MKITIKTKKKKSYTKEKELVTNSVQEGLDLVAEYIGKEGVHITITESTPIIDENQAKLPFASDSYEVGTTFQASDKEVDMEELYFAAVR